MSGEVPGPLPPRTLLWVTLWRRRARQLRSAEAALARNVRHAKDVLRNAQSTRYRLNLSPMASRLREETARRDRLAIKIAKLSSRLAAVAEVFLLNGEPFFLVVRAWAKRRDGIDFMLGRVEEDGSTDAVIRRGEAIADSALVPEKVLEDCEVLLDRLEVRVKHAPPLVAPAPANPPPDVSVPVDSEAGTDQGNPEEWLRLSDAAKLLEVQAWQVTRWANEKPPVLRDNGKKHKDRRVTRESVEAKRRDLLRERQKAAAEAGELPETPEQWQCRTCGMLQKYNKRERCIDPNCGGELGRVLPGPAATLRKKQRED